MEKSLGRKSRKCITVVSGVSCCLLPLACQTTSFQGKTPTRATPPPAPAVANQGEETPPAVTSVATQVAPPPPGTPCSTSYTVPGTANPYLAGEPSGTQISYKVTDGSYPVDTMPGEGPVLVQAASACLQDGELVTFKVTGTISYNSAATPTTADGNLSEISPHQLGAYLGKSNITAPINSLLGVFLGPDDPAASPAPPALDFSTQGDRDYVLLKPQLAQIFYIGAGLTATGAWREVVVPAGATRLYFAVMDTYQWNNNVGSLNAQLVVGGSAASSAAAPN